MNQTWHSLFPLHQLYTCALLRRGRTISTVSKKNSKEGHAATSKSFCINTVFGTREQLGINVDALKTKKDNTSYFPVTEL